MPSKSFDISVADFTHSIGLLVRRARAAAPSHEFSWTESGVLKRLAKDGPATTADLARAEGMKPQSMRTIITTLEETGMVARKPHKTDGRQVNIELTSKGASEQKKSSDAKRTWLAQAIAQLGNKDQETLFAAGRIIKQLVESTPQ